MNQPVIPIDRANKDILDLDLQVRTFLERYPCRVVVERNANPNRLVARFIPAKNYIEGMIPGIVRNAFKNLRAALDLEIAAKVRENGGNPKGAHFPVVNNVNNLPTSMTEALVDRAGPKVVGFVNGLEPYQGGNGELLWATCALDSHLTQLTGATFLGYIVEITRFPNEFGHLGVYTNSTIIQASLLEEHFKVGDDIEATFDIAFLDGLPLKGQPLREAVAKCATSVKRFLDGVRNL